MTMYYLDKVESKNSVWAESLKKSNERADKLRREVLYGKSGKRPMEIIKECKKYLEQLVSSYDTYISLLYSISLDGTIPQKVKYGRRKAKYLEKKIQIVTFVLEPLKKIISEVSITDYSKKDENISTASWILYYLIFGEEKMKEDRIFPEKDYITITKALELIRKKIYKIKLPSEEEMDSIREFQKKLSDKSLSEIVDDDILRVIDETLDSITNSFYEEKRFSDRKAIEKSEKYQYRKKEVKDDTLIELYETLSDYTKKEYGIESIDVEKYKTLLRRKEVLELIIEGLREARSALEKESFAVLDEKKEIKRKNVIEIINSTLSTFKDMLAEIEKEIEKVEKHKKAIADAFRVETVLVEELATLMFKRRIEESYDEKRLEELLGIVKGENYDRAYSLFEKKYNEYIVKKEQEELKRRPKERVLTEKQKLHSMTTADLERELRYIGGNAAIRDAKEHAIYEAKKIPGQIDQSRAPFDIYDLNAGIRSETYEKSYRKELIRKIEMIRSKKEEQKRADEEQVKKIKYDYEQLLRVIKVLKCVKMDTRPSKSKIYKIDEYADYLPNINISEISTNRKALEVILKFLTAAEKKEASDDLKRRISEYLDLCIDIGLVKRNTKEDLAKIIYEELYMVALVEKAITKCQEIYKQNNDELGEFGM